MMISCNEIGAKLIFSNGGVFANPSLWDIIMGILSKSTNVTTPSA